MSDRLNHLNNGRPILDQHRLDDGTYVVLARLDTGAGLPDPPLVCWMAEKSGRCYWGHYHSDAVPSFLHRSGRQPNTVDPDLQIRRIDSPGLALFRVEGVTPKGEKVVVQFTDGTGTRALIGCREDVNELLEVASTFGARVEPAGGRPLIDYNEVREALDEACSQGAE